MAFDPQTRPPVLQMVRDGKPRSFPLTGRITLGRGEEADIRLDDHRVSRLHCRLEPIPGEGIKVTDLGSSNGTTVNGREISQVVLRSGDVAEVGGTSLSLEDAGVGDDRAAQPTSSAGGPPPMPSRSAGPPPVRRPSQPSATSAAPAASGPAAPSAPGGAVPGPRKRRQVRELPSSPSTPPQPAPAAASASAAATPPGAVPATAAVLATPATAAASAAAGATGEPAVSGGARGAAARSKSSHLPMVLLGLAVVAMIAIVVGLGAEDKEAIAHSMEREAATREAADDISGAAAELNDLLARYPGTPAGKRAPEALSRLEARLQQRREGVSRLGSILTDTQIGSFGVMEARLREIGARYAPGVTAADIQNKIDEARRVYGDRAAHYVAGVRTEALALLQSKAYGTALDVVAQAEASGRVTGGATTRLRQVRDLVEGRARNEFGDLLRKIQSLPAAKGLAAIEGQINRFQGTPHAGELRARASLLRADIEREGDAIVVSDADKPSDKPAAPPKEELLRALSRAEGLVGRRAFAAAVPSFEEALTHAPGNDRVRLERRVARVRSMADVVDAVIEAVTSQPGAFRGFKIGATMSGRVTSANREKVSLTLPGATVHWHWSRITPDRFRRLVIRAGLQGQVSVEAATVLLDMGAPALAQEILARRFDKEVNLRNRIQELAAEARGLDAIPAGGFHLRDGRLLTTAENDEAILVARLDQHEAAVRNAAPSQWMQDADALRGLGERGEGRLAAALNARLDGFQKHLDAVPALSRKRVGALRQRLFADLKVRRQKALALIFDSTRYPYPYAPNQKEVQAEVDQLVAACAEIWRTPGRKLVADDLELTALVEDANSVATALETLGHKVDGPEKILAMIDARIDMMHFDGGGGIVAHWTSVIAHNDSLLESGDMTQPERDCYTGTNEYRVMMGMRAVMGDPALIRCARGHSQEMKDLGYFSHTSPTAGRRSPGQRAKLAGWGGSVSENIANGRPSGFDVVRQWCGSSGHHRNILGKGWTHLGAGKAKDGAYWTQNFGRGRSKPPRKK